MSLAKSLRVIPRHLLQDGRGWFVKIIDGHEADLPPRTGEVYVTQILPGQTRGNHFHRDTSEWFTVVQGNAVGVFVSPRTAERLEIDLTAAAPITLFVPAGVAHVFRVREDETTPVILIAYADRHYVPEDTVAYAVL